MKKIRYHDMLRDEIRGFVRFLGCKTMNDMIARALSRSFRRSIILSMYKQQWAGLRGPRHLICILGANRVGAAATSTPSRTVGHVIQRVRVVTDVDRTII